MGFFKKKNTPVTYNEKYLKSEIDMTRDALNAAYSNFDNATDPDLIDCYIYQLNSEQKRYKYLLQLAREYEDNSSLLFFCFYRTADRLSTIFRFCF